jgi:hypothetical protein
MNTDTLSNPYVTEPRSRVKTMLRLLVLAPMVCGAWAFAQPQPGLVAGEEIIGVGLVLSSQGAGLTVIDVVPGSPAGASKLFHENDRILAVGQGEEPAQLVGEKSLTEAVGLMRGKIGSSVRITVRPDGGDEHDAYEVLLKRERLNLARAVAPDGEAPPAGADAPAAALEFAFERLPGGEADKLSNYRGKIVVLGLWATWSAPCEGAITELQGMAGKYKDLTDKVVFITMSMDGGKEKPSAWLKEKGWARTINGRAARESLAALKVNSAPAIYVIGSDGRVLVENPRMTPEMLEDMIKPLVKN